jgi:hypothetical protein
MKSKKHGRRRRGLASLLPLIEGAEKRLERTVDPSELREAAHEVRREPQVGKEAV